MEILESVEVRWFLQAQPERARMQQWFEGRGSEAERADVYLDSGRCDLGVKARLKSAGSTEVETKYRLGSLGSVELVPGVNGVVERWRKLSLKIADPELQSQGRWLPVVKQRFLRSYSWEQGRLTSVAASDERQRAGAGFELTMLEVTTLDGGEKVTGCTIGVETFGPPEQLLAILLATSAAVLHSADQAYLQPSCSMSYPAWVMSLLDKRPPVALT